MPAELAGDAIEAEAFAARFDPQLLSGAEAGRVRECATALKNLCAAVEARAAAREAECGAWRRAGDRSPAEHLARTSENSLNSTHSRVTPVRWRR
jgi:hypothetical protein